MEDGNSSSFNKNNNTSKAPIPKCTATKARASNNSNQPARRSNTSAVPKASSRGRPPLPPSAQLREQDRYLPTANIIRVMRRAVPFNAKISDDAKDTVQECVSEFISFITEEANERCHNEQRKTITADDLIWAMSRLGFDNYVQPLSNYLQRYRESEGLEPRRPLRMNQLPGPTVVGPSVMMPPQSMAGGGPHYATSHNAREGFGASHGLTSSIAAATNTAAAAPTDTGVGHPMMLWPQPVIGPNNPTIHYAGVGFGASHGSTSSTTVTATAAATLTDYGFSPLNEICFDIGGSSHNDGLVDDIGLPPPFDTASSATSDASQGGGQQDESFDPFNHFK